MEEVKKWFSKANEDFDTAKYNLKGRRFNAALFFLQQSAEKALKAFYIKKFKDSIKTHDLIILAKKLDAPDEIIKYCKELNPAYIYTRYPDVIPLENPSAKANYFIKHTNRILKWVKENL